MPNVFPKVQEQDCHETEKKDQTICFADQIFERSWLLQFGLKFLSCIFKLTQQIYRRNMEHHKLVTQISTIPNESKLLTKAMLNSSYSLQNITNPYKDSLPLKFPKKYIRKQTKANMLTQTIQNPEKSCIRNYQHANLSRVFDDPEPRRRTANPGIFHSLSRETIVYQPSNVNYILKQRSFEDMGVPKNRKRFQPAHHAKPDPIVVGEKCRQHNSAFEKVWVQERRHRDNGKFCEQTLNWNTKKQKSYLQLYKKQKGISKNRQF